MAYWAAYWRRCEKKKKPSLLHLFDLKSIFCAIRDLQENVSYNMQGLVQHHVMLLNSQDRRSLHRMKDIHAYSKLWNASDLNRNSFCTIVVFFAKISPSSFPLSLARYLERFDTFVDDVVPRSRRQHGSKKGIH
eukprot:755507-Hanusia_phi.AAC.1